MQIIFKKECIKLCIFCAVTYSSLLALKIPKEFGIAAFNVVIYVLNYIFTHYHTDLISSSFCSTVSFLSFHKLPATMPKNNNSPRFLLDTNFFQQSSGLFMSSV